jgi:hypothetical protein
VSISVDSALIAAKSGRAILFTGAGFSAGFADASGRTLVVGRALAKEFSEQTGKPTEDLRVAAKRLLAHMGPTAYAEYVRERFAVSTVSKDAVDIAGTNWGRIYTTNFDDGFELAATTAHRRVRSVTMADNVAEYRGNRRVCVHVHGFVDVVTPSTADKDLVLTLPAYGSSAFPNSPWKTLFKHDLLAADAVFFVGYSLGDLDISRLLDECDPSIRGKVFFVVRPEDTDVISLVEDYGTVCDFARSGFAERLSATTAPTDDGHVLDFPGFEELWVPPTKARPSDSDLYRLYMGGRVEEDFIWSETGATAASEKYTVERKFAWSEILKLLRQDTPNFFAISGEVANGKTVALSQILRNLRLMNYRTFRLSDRSRNWSAGIQRIFQLAGTSVAVAIDQCALNEEVAKDVISFARKGDVVLLAERTEALEYPLVRLADGIEDDFLQIDVDQLASGERADFISALTAQGMWGELAGATAAGKERLVREDAGNQIRGILLGILESPRALELLKETITQIDFEDSYFDGFVLALILSVTEAAQCTLDVIDDLSGGAPLRRVLAGDAGARSLLKVRSPNRVETVSAVVAAAILRNLVPLHVIVRCITTAIRASENFQSMNSHYQFARHMMQFRLIQQVLPERQSKSLQAVQEIYQEIKSLPQFAREPQFWLQYAICALFLRDFARAQQYFNQAYGSCPPGYDKRKIDNHYARYLVESTLDGPAAPLPEAEAWKNFVQAKELLQSQFTEEAHYPYRVAIAIERFANTYGGSLAPAELAELHGFVQFVLRNASRLIEHGNANRYVLTCRKTLDRVDALLERLRAKKP